MLKSERLKNVFELIDPCNVFYDLFCDHGQLGIQVYREKKSKTVVFNDQVPEIIDKLKNNIDSYITSDLKFISKPAQKLKYIDNSTLSLIGVGHNTIIDVLNNLNTKHQLIVSTHTRPFELRQFLNNYHCKLIEERLIFENGKFYEILKLGTYENEVLTLIGNYPKNDVYKAYIQKYIDYYHMKLSHRYCSVSKEILNQLLEKKKEY